MARPEFDWEIEDYIRSFWLNKWLILFATALFGTVAWFHAQQQPNIYMATARMIINSEAPEVVEFRSQGTPYRNPYMMRDFLQTEYRVISSRAVVSRVVDDLKLAAFPPFSKAKDPVSVLQGMLTVELVRGTQLVDIHVTGAKPELVSRLANAVADTYAKVNLERRKETTSGGVEWLQDEVTKMEEKVRASQIALQQFMEQHGTMDLGEDQQNTVLQRLQALNAAITETRKQRIEAETKYKEKHPKLLELQAKEQELQLALIDQEQKALELSRLSIQYNRLKRETKTSEGIYDILLTRLKELSVQEGVQANNVQVVDYALTPDSPIGPARGREVAVGTVLGLLLGLGAAFLLEFLPKSLRTRKDFERLLEIPFLGYIPLIQINKRAPSESLVVVSAPKSQVAESIRSVRTTLEFLLPQGQTSTLMVTSALPEEGKSLCSMNLAIALQELGRKVVLIDADLRRPSVHRFFKLDIEPGLSTYLEGKAEIADLARKSTVSNNLSIIPSGLTPAQPTDLLSSPKLRLLLETLGKEYQYIVIDTPPVLVAADAAALSTIADGVVFLVRAGRTHGEAALAGKQRLVDVGAKLIGGILNGARLELEQGYRYYYYYRYEQKAGRPRRSSAG